MNRALLIVTVFWTVQFSNSQGRMTYQKGQDFLNEADAIEFVLRKPKAGKSFECVSSWTGAKGTCRIIDMWVKGGGE